MRFLGLPVTAYIGLFAWKGLARVANGDALLQAGLKILSPNDLLNSPAAGSGVVLITEPSPFSAAQATCRGLHEDLLSPEPCPVGLNTSLRYEIFQGHYPKTQLFWASASSRGSCRAVDASGQVHERPCQDQLPALCTQSAPTSNGTFEDVSGAYQITRPLGQGQLTGYRDFYVWKFLGVRFAAQPGRFEYSTVYENGNNSATALARPKACIQGEVEVPRNITSEDCLFLNIWTPYLPAAAPASGSAKLKPVVVWVHGGGYINGANLAPHRDGTNLASRGDVVVVAAGYRLGNLGFLPFADGVHNGNYALGDLVTALEWVSKNIAAFGGDPSSVTLMGQSAGAAAVHALTGSPKAHGLFHKAIAMSDPFGLNLPGVNYDRFALAGAVYNDSTVTLLKETSCFNVSDPIACLRAVDPFLLVTNFSVNYHYPVQDNIYITGPKYDFADPSALGADIPTILGNVKDEFAINTPIPPDNMTLQTWMTSALAQSILGVPQDLSPYFKQSGLPLPANATRDQIFNITAHLLTDGFYICLGQAKAYSGSKHGSLKKVYLYNFNRTYQLPIYTNPYCSPPKTEARPYGDPDLPYFRCHSSDMLVMWGTIARIGSPDRDGLDFPFSRLILDYWASFIRTADPNPDPAYMKARGYLESLEQAQSSGPWTPVDASNPLTRELQWNGRMMPFLDGSICAGLGLSFTSLEHN
ncbi:alpha/beta-hydrolase [Thozetella sp. PMI_491]|nr:alpha/beta-hydrolase [Thozetella sp. PMI_491]